MEYKYTEIKVGQYKEYLTFLENAGWEFFSVREYGDGETYLVFRIKKG